MTAHAITRLLTAAFVAGGVIGAVGALVLDASRIEAAAAPRAPAGVGDELARLKASFRRPATVPFPADNPFSEKKRALGEALFNDKRLSIDNSFACASCHDRAK